MENDVKPSPSQAQRADAEWKICGALLSAALLASLAVLPYLLEILTAAGKQVVVWELVASTVMEHLLLASIAVWIGLRLGPKVGLGTPLLTDLFSGKTGWKRRAQSSFVAALIGGIGVTVALSLADPWLKELMPPWSDSAREAEEAAENLAAWKSLLASFSAGITEEILFRYGLMTLLVWLGAKIRRQDVPGVFVFWLANLLVALLFSLAHLTNLLDLGIAITPGAVLYVIIWNGIASIVFGWLYWRRGLESAVLAHSLADVVVKVIVPMFTSRIQ